MPRLDPAPLLTAPAPLTDPQRQVGLSGLGCTAGGGSLGAGRKAGEVGGPPDLLLALGAHPHALGHGLEGRVQAAEVVGAGAGAARLQVRPSLAGGTVLIVGDLVLKEKGGRRSAGEGWGTVSWVGGALHPASPVSLGSSGRGIGLDPAGGEGEEEEG